MNFIEIKDKDGKVVKAINSYRILYVNRDDCISANGETIYQSIIHLDNGTNIYPDVPIEDIISQLNE